MPIEFPCPECGQRLRVPDSSTGKQARCPECNTISVIPDGSPFTSPRGDQAEIPGSSDQAPNPYAPPATESISARPQALQRGRVTTEGALGTTWRLFRANWVACLLFTLLTFALYFVFQLFSGVLLAPLAILAHQAIYFVVAQIAGAIVQGIVGAVMVVFGTNILYGRDPWKQLFPSGAVVVRVVLVNMVRSAAILVTFGAVGGIFAYAQFQGIDSAVAIAALIAVSVVLAIVGFNVFFRLLIADYFVVDQQQTTSAALASSSRYMQGNKLSAFIAMLALSVIMLLAMVVTLFLAFLVTMGAYAIFMAVIYGMATNQVYRQRDESQWDRPLAPVSSG
jgi:hypothetical protein